MAALLFLSGIKTRVGYGSNLLARGLLTKPVSLDRKQYAAAMYQDLSVGIGAAKIPSDQCLPVAKLRQESLVRMSAVLNNATVDDANGRPSRRRKILLHPGTSKLAVEKGIIKTWSTDNWLSLISKMQESAELQVILAGGPDDQVIIEELSARVSPNAHFISAIGQTKSLADLAALIHLCDLLVCVDSAPMHLAVSLKKPLVALFGPTDERKLLPAHKMFKALRDRPISEFPRQLEDGLGVLLQPDTVYQSVWDQLREWTALENSQACSQ